MAFVTLLWKSVILTSIALLLRDIAGIGSAPRPGIMIGRYTRAQAEYLKDMPTAPAGTTNVS